MMTKRFVGPGRRVPALHEDVGKAYATVRAWIDVLDALYYSFRIRPYVGSLRRALRADRKLYLYDVLRIPSAERAKRLENLTALHLLKACEYWTDTAQGEFELCYARTKDGAEVDFVVVRDNRPWLLVECGLSDTAPAKSLLAMSELLKPAHRVQLVPVLISYRAKVRRGSPSSARTTHSQQCQGAGVEAQERPGASSRYS
jgi:predicted AAA+ superfamily ATPase